MAVGLKASEANSRLDSLITSFPWIRLHTGDPGANGTANIAGNATMKNTSSSWASASGGTKATNAAISWSDPEVDTTETYTYFTMWDDSVPTNFGFSGTVSADEVNATGDTFTINSGGLTIDFNVAA